MVTSHDADIPAEGGVNDLGPLAWVLDETRRSLEAAARALKQFARESRGALGVDLASVDASQLRIGRQQLHQVVGALELVGQAVAARVVRGMEAAVQQFVAYPERCDEAAAADLERAGFALVEFMQSQLGERPRSALGLFPNYRRVQELACADRIHPADLWDKEWRWAVPETPESARVPTTYQPEVRQRLDHLVLKILQDRDATAAAELGDISLALAAGQGSRQTSAFWTLAAGFFEALQHSALPWDIHVKRVIPRILLQYVALARGDGTVSERLAYDLLFFCAQAHPAPGADLPLLRAVRAAWGVEKHQPVDYEQATFGLFDPAVLAQARRRVDAVKETWSALAGGEMTRLKACVDQFGQVAESLIKLNPAGAALANALNHVAAHTARTGLPPTAEVAVETATSLLFLEASFADFQPQHAIFAERCAQLAQRLETLLDGGMVPPLQPWMEALYRRVSERETMGTVVEELRASLADIEHHLDQFSRTPEDANLLTPVPVLMTQMRGVLSVLGLEEASRAVAHMRHSVDALASGDGTSGSDVSATFQRMGHTLGSLGFLIDMLGYQPALARTAFVFDADAGELRSVVPRAGSARKEMDGTEIDLDLGQDGPVSQEALDRFFSHSTEPQALPAHLEQLAVDAALEEKPALARVAGEAALAARDRDASSLSDAMERLSDLARPASVPEVLERAPDAADQEDDLLTIFVQEAREVVDSGAASVHALETDSNDLAHQAIIRRAFHTLKGSSRMVGLNEFGEAAWAMEQAFNRWLAEQKSIDTGLLDLAREAFSGLRAWVEAIAEGADDGWRAVPFRTAADAWRLHGQREALVLPQGLLDFASESIANVPPVVREPVHMPDASTTIEAPRSSVLAAQADVEPLHVPTPTRLALPPIEFPDLSLDAIEPAAAESDPVANAVSQSSADLNIQVTTLDEDEFEAAFPGAATASAGSAVEELPVPVAEAAADSGAAPVDAVNPDVVVQSAALVEDEFRQIGDLRIGIPLYNVYLNEADEWSRQLLLELSEWSLTLDRPVPDSAMAHAHALAGASAAIGLTSLSRLARAVEHALQRLHTQTNGTVNQTRTLNEAAEDIRRVLHQFAVGTIKEPNADVLKAVDALEALDDGAVDSTLRPDMAEAVPTALSSDLAQPAGEVIRPVAVVADQPPAAARRERTLTFTATGATVPSIADHIDVLDAVDDDLFPIFEEEADELLPRLATGLRRWVHAPSDSGARAEMLRALHTLKGSARLAGALRLGEMAHRTESAIELMGPGPLTREDLEPLLDHLEDIQAGFQQLRPAAASPAVGVAVPSPHQELVAPSVDIESEPVHAPAELVGERAGEMDDQPVPAVRLDGDSVAQPAALSLATSRATAGQAVRVRAQLLDRLVSQAGEVITSRSRLEEEVGHLRHSLGDLTGNLERLRQQLRDVELQAETQMQTRMALSRDAQQEFDPLEFDRFTRMQELTRMMAESVNDVATVQRGLQRAVEASEDDLAAQARQARELQRDLLRTRMVEFDGISERLYRVVRQASKETGKSVKLDLIGGAIELDRGVLDRMTPAFEHLLRNSVVHGIESAAVRAERHKEATGSITIEVQQAGNDVSVSFRDDGGGLDMARIRARAVDQGLVAADQAMTDEQLANLIFNPGFSTASEVTELAGRGVGMDVVRSEVQSLGGRIETQFHPGQGAAFKLIMPLTTAVTHVVMVRAGALTVAVPSNLVEIVHRCSIKDLPNAYAAGTYVYGDQTLPFFWGGALLQSSPRSVETAARTVPVVIFRSADQRIAVHVDEVLGNQEVVVKSLGPQLARLPGLVAVTALASGAVALVYNPVALAAVYGEQARAFSAHHAQPGAGEGGGRADAVAQQPLVLVVDDSITVRRVTQRLLLREGFRVALAADGLQALESLQGERPAVVLSDIEMPRMDGFDLLRNIRADADLRDLPVVMITSRIAEKHREHARELGADHYLGKPYSEDELLGLIRRYVRAGAAAAVA